MHMRKLMMAVGASLGMTPLMVRRAIESAAVTADMLAAMERYTPRGGDIGAKHNRNKPGRVYENANHFGISPKAYRRHQRSLTA